MICGVSGYCDAQIIVFVVPLQITYYYNNIDIYCSLIDIYCS